MTDRPTPEQLDHLLGHADSRRLTAAEAALLRAGVQQARQRAAVAEAWAHHWLYQAARGGAEADRARSLHQPHTLGGLPTGRCSACQYPTPCPTARELPVHIAWEDSCTCDPTCPANDHGSATPPADN